MNINSSDDRGSEPPSDDLAAAEYVLGVTSATEREAAQRRIAAEPAFSASVTNWERRLAPLALEVEPLDVSAQVWEGIRARLGWLETVNRNRGPLAFWRLATALATAVALAAMIIAVLPRFQAPRVIALSGVVTTLARGNGTPGWLATVDVRDGTLQIVPVPSAADAQGRAAELWLIPPGQPPHSLGAVSVSRAHTVEVPRCCAAS